MWVAGAAGQLRTGFYDATNAAYNTYNTYFNMATESAGNLVLLTQEVTVPASCTSGQFILSLHSTDPTYCTVLSWNNCRLGCYLCNYSNSSNSYFNL
jgi:hypothetical protein